MRWVICMAAIVLVSATLYAGFNIAANMGFDIRVSKALAAAPTGTVIEQTACQRSQRFQYAKLKFEEARRLISSFRFERANSILDTAIEKLGNSYELSSPVLDDTGQHLTLANILVQKGDLKHAALIKCSMLHDRLELCGDILQDNKMRYLGSALPQCSSS
jgi:hypothetical protein